MTVAAQGWARVALVADWCLPRPGGIEMHIMALAGQLRRRGVEASIITSYPGPAVIDGVPIDRLGGVRLPWLELAASPFLVSTLRDRFVAGRFDAVHIHASIVAPTCLAAALAATRLGLPTVVTFHSVMRWMPHVLHALDRMAGWSDRNMRLTAVSGLIAGQLRRALEGRAVDVLPNGFDHDFWRAGGAARPASSRLRLVSAMRLQPRKRPFALVDIFAQACRLAPEADLSLTIAGDGDLRRPLRRHIERRGMAGRIEIVGWQSREELRRLYRDATAFVMPSRREAFCIAALEARAAGLPVIANAGTGIADFVTHGVCGLLVTDDAQMAAAIARLAADETLRTALSADAPFVARYDWSSLVEQHLRLYADAGLALPSESHDAGYRV